MLIRSISGVRGIVGTYLTVDVFQQYLRAANSIFADGVIYLGRDSRSSGEELMDIAFIEFKKLGRDVINCGIVPTPSIQYIVKYSEGVGGIVVTASHNPSKWNGLKFVREDGTFFYPKECQKLYSLVDKHPKIKPAKTTGMVWQDYNIIQKHVFSTVALSCINSKAIQKRNFKVVIDAVNGAGAIAMPMLLETLGCDVHRIHCEPSGEFVRGTEPLPENLGDLCQAVHDVGADVGMAVDPDCDRLAIVDDTGKPLGEEYTLVLAADGYLGNAGSDEAIVTNLSTTLALDRVAEKYGNHVVRTPIGEINVVAEMERSGAKLGGEGNGGVILRESHLGRDALVGAAMVLNRMVQSKKSLHKIFKGLPQFTIIKDKIKLDELDFEEVRKAALAVFVDVLVDDRDGLKFIWPDRWLHMRKSNTEPILRIYAEGTDIAVAKGLIKTLKSVIN